MKILKRNAVVLSVLLFVCVAVYLNWSFGRKDNTEEPAPDTNEPTENTAAQVISVNQSGNVGASGLFFTADSDSTTGVSDLIQTDYTDYFAAVRLSRSQARDEATQTLQVACSTSEASPEFIETATMQIMDIAQWTMQEADLENLIKARGFEDCVVYMTENRVSVTVPAPTEGLSDASVAKITDVILSETAYDAQQINIIEIK